MVTNRDVCSDAIPYVAYMLAKETSAPTLEALRDEIVRRFLEYQKRKLVSHALQIACDLMSLGLVEVEDTTDCPRATGSERGLKRVHEYDQDATVRSLAEQTGREAHVIQTSLCKYDKYCRRAEKKRRCL